MAGTNASRSASPYLSRSAGDQQTLCRHKAEGDMVPIGKLAMLTL